MKFYLTILSVCFFSCSTEKLVVSNPYFDTQHQIFAESEKEYINFLRKRSEIRKTLDLKIEQQDLEKIEILKEAYQNHLVELRQRWESVFMEFPERRNPYIDIFFRQLEDLRFGTTDTTFPLLAGNKELMKIAEELAHKYHSEIMATAELMSNSDAMKKLKKKKLKVRRKYMEDPPSEVKYKASKAYTKRDYDRDKINVYADAKILIMPSE